MSDSSAALLFPGQGAFSGAALKEVAAEYPQIAETLTTIDEVAKGAARRLPDRHSARRVCAEHRRADERRSPDVLQLAIYATSIGLYRILETYGLQPNVLIGHSLGEISAMVCGGAFSVRDGAEIVCHRVEALRAIGKEPGYMVALGTNAAPRAVRCSSCSRLSAPRSRSRTRTGRRSSPARSRRWTR